MREVIVQGDATGFSQQILAGAHALTADEPVEGGGADIGPAPYDLLLAALGACASMTVGMYARRKAWPLESVTVRLRHSRIHAADCAQSRRVRWQVGGDGSHHNSVNQIGQGCPAGGAFNLKHMPCSSAVRSYRGGHCGLC